MDLVKGPLFRLLVTRKSTRYVKMPEFGMFGQNFPVSPYYKGRVIDAVTISRGGGWWTAVLVIRDPKTEKPFVACYRWEQKNGEWKTRKSFAWKKAKDLRRFSDAIDDFVKYYDQEDSAD